MSQKNLDRHNRWRSVTVSFRVSPEENRDIQTRVRLSGLTKQEYICRRLMERDVVVIGNPRVYKALKEQMERLITELQRIEAGQQIDAELQDTIRTVAETFGGMRNTSQTAKGD